MTRSPYQRWSGRIYLFPRLRGTEPFGSANLSRLDKRFAQSLQNVRKIDNPISHTWPTGMVLLARAGQRRAFDIVPFEIIGLGDTSPSIVVAKAMSCDYSLKIRYLVASRLRSRPINFHNSALRPLPGEPTDHVLDPANFAHDGVEMFPIPSSAQKTTIPTNLLISIDKRLSAINWHDFWLDSGLPKGLVSRRSA